MVRLGGAFVQFTLKNEGILVHPYALTSLCMMYSQICSQYETFFCFLKKVLLI